MGEGGREGSVWGEKEERKVPQFPFSLLFLFPRRIPLVIVGKKKNVKKERKNEKNKTKSSERL